MKFPDKCTLSYLKACTLYSWSSNKSKTYRWYKEWSYLDDNLKRIYNRVCVYEVHLGVNRYHRWDKLRYDDHPLHRY